jgi:hypothetical protein
MTHRIKEIALRYLGSFRALYFLAEIVAKPLAHSNGLGHHKKTITPKRSQNGAGRKIEKGTYP